MAVRRDHHRLLRRPRLAGAYDYKTWSRNLVGPLWWLVDLLILSMMMLVIAVMTAAIGEVLQQTVGLPKLLSLAIALACVGFLSWRGSGFIEKAKTWGSAALYLGYCAFAVLVLTAPVEGVAVEAVGAAVAQPVAAASTTAATAPEGGLLEVIVAAVLYVAYNVAVVPAVLFCLHRQTRRSETFSSGALAGVAMTVPFALTLACLLRSPQASVMEAEVPWLPLIGAAADGRAGGPALWIAIFGLVAGWTLIETAVGSIHALLRRVESNLDDLPRRWRPASGKLTRAQKAGTAVGVLVAAAGLSTFGIIDLVARGYGTLAWGFIALVVVPLFVVVPYRAFRGAERRTQATRQLT
ncbi:MAG: hypothetical protein J4F98_10785 [Acidobacteria bacterium]|nr:hypothetical protein [Acidobacteriota bacterium]